MVGPNKKIWRYMEFWKFQDCLSHGGLFFACLDHMSDRFEGHSGLRFAKRFWKTFDPDLKLRKLMSDSRQDQRQRSMVNCWYLDEFESARMWAQYGKVGQAVALQSTYARLQQCVSVDDRVKLRDVEYRSDYPESFRDRVFHKRPKYADEKEIRAHIFNSWDNWDQLPDNGLWVPIDLRTLIEAVYVAPSSDSAFASKVGATMSNHNLSSKPVLPSSLSKAPIAA